MVEFHREGSAPAGCAAGLFLSCSSFSSFCSPYFVTSSSSCSSYFFFPLVYTGFPTSHAHYARPAPLPGLSASPPAPLIQSTHPPALLVQYAPLAFPDLPAPPAPPHDNLLLFYPPPCQGRLLDPFLLLLLLVLLLLLLTVPNPHDCLAPTARHAQPAPSTRSAPPDPPSSSSYYFCPSCSSYPSYSFSSSCSFICYPIPSLHSHQGKLGDLGVPSSVLGVDQSADMVKLCRCALPREG